MAWNSVHIDVNKSKNASQWLNDHDLKYGEIYNPGIVASVGPTDVLYYQVREKINGEYTGRLIPAIPDKFKTYFYRRIFYDAFEDTDTAKLSKRIYKAYLRMVETGALTHYTDNQPVDKNDVKEYAAKCGEIYGKLNEDNTVVFEFYTGKVNWIAGSFGNPSSCWLGGGAYGIAKNMIESAMEADKAFTIRFYSKRGSNIVQCPDERYTGFSGYGRLWGIMLGDNPVLFNAYPGHDDGKRYMDAITGMLEMAYTKISIADENSDMHINNHMGYLIHDVDNYDNRMDNVTFTLPDYDHSIGACCAMCGDYEEEDDMYYVEDRGYICEYCFNRHYFYCNRCGETFNQSELCNCDGNDYCETCASVKGYTVCDDCQEYTQDYHVTVDGQTLCANCADAQGYKYCDVCGECHDDNVTVDGEEINTCETCASGRYDLCDDCHGYTDNPLETHTGYICETCASTRGYNLCETCNKYCIGTIDNTCPYCKE